MEIKRVSAVIIYKYKKITNCWAGCICTRATNITPICGFPLKDETNYGRLERFVFLVKKNTDRVREWERETENEWNSTKTSQITLMMTFPLVIACMLPHQLLCWQWKMCTIFFAINTHKRWYRLFNVICDYCSRYWIHWFDSFLRVCHTHTRSLARMFDIHFQSFHVLAFNRFAITQKATTVRGSDNSDKKKNEENNETLFALTDLHGPRERINMQRNLRTYWHALNYLISCALSIALLCTCFLLYRIFYSFWWQNLLFNVFNATNPNQKCQVLELFSVFLFFFVVFYFFLFCHFVSAQKYHCHVM